MGGRGQTPWESHRDCEDCTEKQEGETEAAMTDREDRTHSRLRPWRSQGNLTAQLVLRDRAAAWGQLKDFPCPLVSTCHQVPRFLTVLGQGPGKRMSPFLPLVPVTPWLILFPHLGPCHLPHM